MSGARVLRLYDAGLNNVEALQKAFIGIERSAGPLLLLSGGDDQMWPASRILRDLAIGWAKNERDRLERDEPF